jgi:hypothetical protein
MKQSKVHLKKMTVPAYAESHNQVETACSGSTGGGLMAKQDFEA